jgi:hypothetical protein
MADLVTNADGTYTYQAVEPAAKPATVTFDFQQAPSPTSTIGAAVLTGEPVTPPAKPEPVSFTPPPLPSPPPVSAEGYSAEFEAKRAGGPVSTEGYGATFEAKRLGADLLTQPAKEVAPLAGNIAYDAAKDFLTSKYGSLTPAQELSLRNSTAEQLRTLMTREGAPAPDVFPDYLKPWSAIFPGLTPQQIQDTFFKKDENGNLVINIPSFAGNAYLEKIGPMIEDKISSNEDLWNAYKAQGVNDLTRIWRDSWNGLMEQASSLGLSHDGLGLLMMVQGKADLLDKLTGYNLDMMIKKGELDKDVVSWAFDLIKYGQAEADLRYNYYAAQLQGIKDMLQLSQGAYEFAQQYGLDAARLNFMQNELDSNVGLGTFKAVMDAAADGLIPPEALDNIITAATEGRWEDVFQTLEEYDASIPDGTYTTEEDLVATTSLYDESGYIYNTVEYVDDKGNKSWDVNLIYQEITLPDGSVMRGIARSKDNGQLNTLISAATQQGKRVISERNPDGTITYKIGDEAYDPATQDVVLDSFGNVNYVDKGEPAEPVEETVMVNGVPKTMNVIASPAKTGQPSWTVYKDPTTGAIYYREHYFTADGEVDSLRSYDELIDAVIANPDWQTEGMTTFIEKMLALSGQSPAGGLDKYILDASITPGSKPLIEATLPAIYDPNSQFVQRDTVSDVPSVPYVQSGTSNAGWTHTGGTANYNFKTSPAYKTIGNTGYYVGAIGEYLQNGATFVEGRLASNAYQYAPIKNVSDNSIVGWLIATPYGSRVMMTTDFNTAFTSANIQSA